MQTEWTLAATKSTLPPHASVLQPIDLHVAPHSCSRPLPAHESHAPHAAAAWSLLLEQGGLAAWQLQKFTQGQQQHGLEYACTVGYIQVSAPILVSMWKGEQLLLMLLRNLPL